jgi:hypothetical protein
MKITVHFPAVMRIDGIQSGKGIDVEEHISIEDLLRSFNVREEHLRFILAYVNGERQGLSHTLRPDDVLKLYLPIGGG